MKEFEASQVEEAASGGVGKRDYVRAVFERIAPSYDLLNHLLSFNLDRRWRRRAIAALGWERSANGTYLDLCAGTMDVGATLGAIRAFEGRIVALDFAEAMLRAGRHKVVPQVVVPVVADALRLPVADGSMSGAIVAFGMRNLVDLDEGLREVHRVLEPGGRFVILEFTTPRSLFVRAAYHVYFHHVLPFVGGTISGHRGAYRYLPRSVAYFPNEAQLTLRLNAAGFTAVSFVRLSLGVAAIHVGERA